MKRNLPRAGMAERRDVKGRTRGTLSTPSNCVLCISKLIHQLFTLKTLGIDDSFCPDLRIIPSIRRKGSVNESNITLMHLALSFEGSVFRSKYIFILVLLVGLSIPLLYRASQLCPLHTQISSSKSPQQGAMGMASSHTDRSSRIPVYFLGIGGVCSLLICSSPSFCDDETPT
jgi:hypothetical protein